MARDRFIVISVDYGNVYYEGDTPELCVEIYDNYDEAKKIADTRAGPVECVVISLKDGSAEFDEETLIERIY